MKFLPEEYAALTEYYAEFIARDQYITKTDHIIFSALRIASRATEESAVAIATKISSEWGDAGNKPETVAREVARAILKHLGEE
jgi:hypothetical protein